MSDVVTTGRVYCHECKETQLDVGFKRCAWCDSELTPVDAINRKRKRNASSKWDDLKVNQCWAVYLKGHSCNEIAQVIWEAMGFASANGCSNSMYAEFKACGFKLRTQSAVTASRNFKHGHGTRAARAAGGEGEYRRWFKREHGLYNPNCAHDGCIKHAMDDDEFCYAHSPARAEERDQLCAAMRAKSTRVFVPGEDHVMAKLTTEDVADIKARPKEPLEVLAQEYHVCKTTISKIRTGVNWAHVEPDRWPADQRRSQVAA